MCAELCAFLMTIRLVDLLWDFKNNQIHLELLNLLYVKLALL
jgi:hypothetical protein